MVVDDSAPYLPATDSSYSTPCMPSLQIACTRMQSSSRQAIHISAVESAEQALRDTFEDITQRINTFLVRLH